jgi:hypothetical protein
MTRSLRLALMLGVACGCAHPALSDDPPRGLAVPNLPEHVVARVLHPDGSIAGELTFDTLERAIVGFVMPELDEFSHPALTVLRMLIEERLVEQEATRLGIAVTDADAVAYERKLDGDVRLRSGGQKTLADMRKEKGMTVVHFRAMLRMQLLKERVASHPSWLGKLPEDEGQRLNQIGVVVTELHTRAVIKWHVRVNDILLQQAKQAAPAPDPSGALATVNGSPITSARYGEALVQQLPEELLKEYVDKECATKLLQVESVALDEAAMESELQLRERNWLVQRTMLSQTEWHNVSYEEFLKASLKKTRAELKADRYYRSYYGLVARERLSVGDAEVAEEFEKKKDTHYGAAILVDAIQIGFERKNALMSGGGREKHAALQLAGEVQTRVNRGQPFDVVVRDVAKRHVDPRTKMPDRTVRAGERRLYNTSADRILYDAAAKLEDGEMSMMVETLAEIHLLKRKGTIPGPTLDAVREVIRDHIAGQRAQKRMLDQAKDPKRVQVRWPIRQV